MRLIPFENLAVAKGITYSRSQIWRKVRGGSFPAPVKASTARTAWLESEIDAWIDGLVAERDERVASAAALQAAFAPPDAHNPKIKRLGGDT